VDKFRSDCKDKLHYLQHQITELPAGRAFARDLIQSKEYQEKIFGPDMKYADKRSEGQY